MVDTRSDVICIGTWLEAESGLYSSRAMPVVQRGDTHTPSCHVMPLFKDPRE